MAIYRGIGGTGDSATGEDVFGPNSSITSLDGITGGIEDPTYVRFAADNGGHIPLQGDLSWNTTEGTLDLGLNGGDVILQIGQEVHYRVTNQSGVSIPNGSLVAFAGTTGNSGKLLVELYDGTQPSKYVVGLATETIANGSNGYVTHFGKVRGIQTNGVNYGETWVDGDELYPDAGGLTNILPEAPNPKQPVAVVVNSHGSNGELFVRVQGHTSLEDDEKVQLTSLTNNDLLQYDAAQARFENRSLSAAGVQPTLVSGTNIKTVNSTSLVGSGDVQVQAYDANLTSFVSTFTLPTVDGSNGFVLTTDGAGLLQFSAGGGGLADGDKGDITVSGGGTVWTIDNTVISTGKIADDAVTYAKIQNVSATDKLLGRSTAGAGDIEEITCTAAGRALLDDVDNAAQRTTLGLGTIATQAANSVAITGGSITGITDLAIADGGTGASDAATAFSNIKQAATDTATGVVELATNAEVVTGTDTTRVVTPASMKAGLNATGTAPIYACRAWVNFNGTGTVSIRASGNVSSITDNGTGQFQLNFTTAMPDTNYSPVAIAGDGTAGSNGGSIFSAIENSTGNCKLDIRNTSNTLTDRAVVCVSVFR
jgi:hypothetical protein